MNVLETEVLQGFVRLCSDGWEQNWHERNGGNLTCRLRPEEIEACLPGFRREPGEWIPMGVQAENLKGEFFLSTGTGKYFRNVPLCPQDNLCIAQLNDKGDAYRVVWGLEKGGLPTSEFPSHILNHSVRTAVTNGECRVIYHAHCPNVIAMTYLLPLTAKAFTRALWQSATECPVVFPGGVGVVEWMVPGKAEIAVATSTLMKEYDAVVWAHHGLFVSGSDFDTTFGLMHTIENAARIYLLVLSCGKQSFRQTISDENLRAIAREFGVTLREEFLS